MAQMTQISTDNAQPNLFNPRNLWFFYLVISGNFSTFVSPKNNYSFMQSNQELSISSMGRTELAQRYFPHILPQTAWQKLRGLLAEDPDLAPLTTLKRRTFLLAEVNIIYQRLGRP